MRLPKKLSDAVVFAVWCQREQQDPPAVARLLVLAAKAKRAGEVYCNENKPGTRQRYDNAMIAFEAAAQELGYATTWPGLWPVLARGGQDVYLPDV